VTTSLPARPHYGIPVAERSACALAARIGTPILEVLSGRRPAHQIRDRVSGPVAGLLAATRAHTAKSPDYRLRSVHACLVTSHRVEACMVVATHNRVRAVVLRLEQEASRWLCTMLALL